MTKKTTLPETKPGEAPRAELGARIRRLRVKNRLSLRDLAGQVGYSASFLSRIETNMSSPTVRQLEKVGAALGIPVEEFFRAPAPSSQALMVRHAIKRSKVLGKWNGVTLQHLLLTIERGGKSGRWASRRPMPELAIVLRGRVGLKLGQDHHDLEQSDSVCYDIAVPHQWVNLGAGQSEVVLINTHFTPLDEWPGIFDPENQDHA